MTSDSAAASVGALPEGLKEPPGAVPEEAPTVENSAPGSRFLPFAEDPEYGDFSDEARAERRERNLDAIRGHDASLADALEKYEPGAELVFDEDGGPNVRLGGRSLYEMPVREYNSLQYEQFWHTPDRIYMSPLQPDSMDNHNARLLHDMIKRIHEDGISLYAAPETRRCHHVLFLGIGLGLHIERVVEETQCHFPIFIEPNLEFLHHSLEITEWARIFETLEERGGRPQFLVHGPGEHIDRNVRNVFRMNGPCAFDGTAVFRHYDLPLFDNFIQFFRKKAVLAIYGFGFLEDELFMIRHSYANLCDGGARISQRTGVKKQPCPVFLIGSGPSLDRSMDVIRAHQDRAVIFSCGTALRALLAAGITPDLHLEIEREVDVMPLIQQPAEEFDLKKIMLVASTTVDPRMQGYFGRTVYYFRKALAPAPMFAPNDECQPDGCGPSVVNGAMGFAQDVGFREFYLFGVDFGTKSAGFYHSQQSWQHTADGYEPARAVCGTPAPGNFGGTVLTNKDLIWTREELEASIRNRRSGRRYYNCSDGQRIDGAKAALARSVDLPEITAEGGKPGIIDALWETFPVYTREFFEERWNDSTVTDEIDDYIDEIIKILNENPNLEDRRYLNELHRHFVYSEDPRRRIWAHVFRGTVMSMLVGVEFYLSRIRGREDFERARDIAREELINLAEAMREAAREELADMKNEAKLMKYVNRKDLNTRSEKETPDPLPLPGDLQKLFDAQPWAEDLKALYAKQAEKKETRLARRAAEQKTA